MVIRSLLLSASVWAMSVVAANLGATVLAAHQVVAPAQIAAPRLGELCAGPAPVSPTSWVSFNVSYQSASLSRLHHLRGSQVEQSLFCFSCSRFVAVSGMWRRPFVAQGRCSTHALLLRSCYPCGWLRVISAMVSPTSARCSARSCAAGAATTRCASHAPPPFRTPTSAPDLTDRSCLFQPPWCVVPNAAQQAIRMPPQMRVLRNMLVCGGPWNLCGRVA